MSGTRALYSPAVRGMVIPKRNGHGQSRPDVVIVDVHMPGMSGLEAARRIKTRPNPPRVLLTTIHDGSEYQRAAAAVGADGFVPKSEFGARILAAIVGGE